MVVPFSRLEISSLPHRLLVRGKWGNADIILVEKNNIMWVVKDFGLRPPAIAKTWGRFLVRREYHAFCRLAGMDGIPSHPFLLDPNALGYRYIPGIPLREAKNKKIPAGFFPALEELVSRMHERGIVHLDARNMRNIILTNQGKPALIDFQSSVDLEKVPPGLHGLLKEIDLSGVYKVWARLQPCTLDDNRRKRLHELERIRKLWVFKGYSFIRFRKKYTIR